MKLRLWAPALLMMAGVWYFGFERPAGYGWQQIPAAPEGQQFRIIVGLKDTEPRRWQGKVQVTGAEIVSLTGWRFAAQDRAAGDGSFNFLTKMQPFEDQLRPGSYFGQTEQGAPPVPRHVPEGLLLKVRGSGSARVTVDSGPVRIEFNTSDVQYGARLLLADGNAMVERLPLEHRISTPGETHDQVAAATASDGTVWTAWVAYRDKSDVVMASDGSRVFPLGERGDLHAPAIATGMDGLVWVVWPRNDNGVFHLFGAAWRKGAWSRAERLTNSSGNDVWPRMASDGKGNVALVWQGFRGTRSTILLKQWDGKGWSAEQPVSEGEGNCWAPTAAYGGGKLWLAWDSYATGAYQIYARAWKEPVQRVTRGEAFSVRPALIVNASGQPVVAWEESDPLWGKDFAYQIERRGTVEYKNRRVRVAYLAGTEWREIAAPVADAIPREIRRFIQQPQLALDARGRLYLTVR